ncbi:MAG: DegT/DnrJ/EryC1/StrS family aminotransferase [Methylobacteriaceae bacterium]|nr:DegT/DnrJ/EryC1/StrS family aminotransferase [Methylobacteriaceae bacterium]
MSAPIAAQVPLSSLIPRWPPPLDAAVEERLLGVVRSGLWGSTQGQVVETLARRLAALHGVASATCCANGTIAIVLALKAAGVGPGDEVIVPAYTFLATVSAPLLIGAVPVFAEVDPATMLLDPADVARRITTRTRAIIPVHLAGAVADAAAMRAAAPNNVVVIEDAAQAIGAAHVSGAIGQLGDFATLSFQTSKNVASGEGGAVLCRDAAMGERVWSLHNAGRTRGGAWYQHDNVGWNLRMGELQGVLADATLDTLPEMTERREAGFARLRALAAGEGLPVVPLESPGTTRHARHLMLWRLHEVAAHRRDGVVAALQAAGVHASDGYPCLNTVASVKAGIAALGGAADQPLPVTEAAAKRTFWFPQNVLLAGEEAHRAIIAVMARALQS